MQVSDKELQLKDLSEDLTAAQQQTADLQLSLQQEQQQAADLRSQGTSSEQQLQQAQMEVDRQAAELQTLQGTRLNMHEAAIAMSQVSDLLSLICVDISCLEAWCKCRPVLQKSDDR